MNMRLTLVPDNAPVLPEDDTWRDLAACLGFDSDVFFPEDMDAEAVARAKEVCASCPVTIHCLEWALETNQTEGIWGGFTRFERRAVKRRRQRRMREAG